MMIDEGQFIEAINDRFPVRGKIGQGGSAVVFLAEDPVHGRLVALKVLHPQVATVVGAHRFHREIEIAAALSHPHILPLFTSGEAGGFLYYVMPYVEGESLAQRLDREGPLEEREAVRLASEVADALAYAHAKQIVHRDIKPENIMLAAGHATVTDFGIALAMEGAAPDALTATGLVIGSPEYMSPEQCTGERDIDGRSDLYSLGCVLYEMLTGTAPFSGSTRRATLSRHLVRDAPRPSDTRANLSPWIDRVVATCLAKDPEDRFESASRLREELRSGDTGVLTGGAVRFRPPAGVSLFLTGTIVTLALAGLLLAGYLQSGGSTLDTNRVVVFPLRDPGPGFEGAGEDVATMVGHALEGTDPMRWLDGWDRLSVEERINPELVTGARKREIGVAQRAAFFIDGSLLEESDSIRVLLRVYDIVGDSVLHRAGASAPRGEISFHRLGLRAAAELLPPLVGREVDVRALANRNPAAVAHWLLGEKAYRRSAFGPALGDFRQAVEADSAFALAALGGAQAAMWESRWDEASELVERALAHQDLLPGARLHLAHGIRFYVRGWPDSALTEFRAALEQDAEWSEAWMGLGESYFHLLPRTGAADSLAEDAFSRAASLDPTFGLPTYHLAQIALRRGEVERASELRRRFEALKPDSSLSKRLAMGLTCVRDGPGRVDWSGIPPPELLSVAVMLGGGGAQPACAREGYRTVLESAEAVNERWGASIGLLGTLTVLARQEELDALVSESPFGGHLALLVMGSGARPSPAVLDAAGLASGISSDMNAPGVWLRAHAALQAGDVATVRGLAGVLSARAETSGTRLDRFISEIVDALAILAEGDTIRAVGMLGELRPRAAPPDLQWQPWESLGAERLLLARLYLALGRASDAMSTAELLDQSYPVTYPLYLPASLEIRARAAQAMDRTGLAQAYRDRISRLGSG